LENCSKNSEEILSGLSLQSRLSASEEMDNCYALLYSELSTLLEKSYSPKIQIKYKHGKLYMAAATVE
jgi:hypothetical protein